ITPLAYVSFVTRRPPPTSTLFPYTTLFRSHRHDDDPTDCVDGRSCGRGHRQCPPRTRPLHGGAGRSARSADVGHCRSQQVVGVRSEEHTSELQSRENLVCRLLLEKKKQNID